MLQDIPTQPLREASPCVLETERLMLRRPTLADVIEAIAISPTIAALRKTPAACRIPILRSMPSSSCAKSPATIAAPCS